MKAVGDQPCLISQELKTNMPNPNTKNEIEKEFKDKFVVNDNIIALQESSEVEKWLASKLQEIERACYQKIEDESMTFGKFYCIKKERLAQLKGGDK